MPWLRPQGATCVLVRLVDCRTLARRWGMCYGCARVVGTALVARMSGSASIILDLDVGACDTVCTRLEVIYRLLRRAIFHLSVRVLGASSSTDGCRKRTDAPCLLGRHGAHVQYNCTAIEQSTKIHEQLAIVLWRCAGCVAGQIPRASGLCTL